MAKPMCDKELAYHLCKCADHSHFDCPHYDEYIECKCNICDHAFTEDSNEVTDSDSGSTAEVSESFDDEQPN